MFGGQHYTLISIMNVCDVILKFTFDLISEQSERTGLVTKHPYYPFLQTSARDRQERQAGRLEVKKITSGGGRSWLP